MIASFVSASVSDGGVYPILDGTLEVLDSRHEQALLLEYAPISLSENPPPLKSLIRCVCYKQFPGMSLFLREDQWKTLAPRFFEPLINTFGYGIPTQAFGIPVSRTKRFTEYLAAWHTSLEERVKRDGGTLELSDNRAVLWTKKDFGWNLTFYWYIDCGRGAQSTVWIPEAAIAGAVVDVVKQANSR